MVHDLSLALSLVFGQGEGTNRTGALRIFAEVNGYRLRRGFPISSFRAERERMRARRREIKAERFYFPEKTRRRDAVSIVAAADKAVTNPSSMGGRIQMARYCRFP